MKAIEKRLPREFDKSFIVFRESGKFFPVPWHYHPEYELVLVTKSTGRRMVGDDIGYFQPGDLVFMGPKLPHVWVNDAQYNETSDLEADAIVIQFEESFLGKHFMMIPEMEAFREFLSKSNCGMVITGKARTAIIERMEAMLPPGTNGLLRLALLFEIFDILAHTSDYELLASPGYTNHTQNDLNYSDRFSKVTDYIMRNFDREISLPEIAGVANMAMTTFCNFFKEHYRVTFVEYLHKVRIGHACKLLAENDQNVVEVAAASGFNNLANFNRQFIKIMGTTPSEYRKKAMASASA